MAVRSRSPNSERQHFLDSLKNVSGATVGKSPAKSYAISGVVTPTYEVGVKALK